MTKSNHKKNYANKIPTNIFAAEGSVEKKLTRDVSNSRNIGLKYS